MNNNTNSAGIVGALFIMMSNNKESDSVIPRIGAPLDLLPLQWLNYAFFVYIHTNKKYVLFMSTSDPVY